MYAQAARTAYGLLVGSTTWALTREDLDLSTETNVHPTTVLKWLNKDTTRQAMLVLTFETLISGGERQATFTIYSLANALSRDRSMQNTLRNSILPALEAVDWISWQRSASGNKDDANSITVTPAGIERMLDYLKRTEEEQTS